MTTTCTDSTTDLILGEVPHLRVMARRLSRCEAECDDIVQDTLLRAYRARDRFRPGSSVRAWTTTILRRVFLSGRARHKRRRQSDVDADVVLAETAARPAGRESDPDDVRSLAEALDDEVKDALDRVPESQRSVFFMASVRGMTCNEIAMHLNVPVGTVMSRIHRARQKLRADLLAPGGARATRVGFRPIAATGTGA